MPTIVSYKAADQKHGMTLEELSTFVAAAYAEQIDGQTRLDITISLRGKLQKITTT